MEPAVNQTSHTVATWLLDIIDGALDSVGLHRFQAGEEVLYLAIIIAAAFLLGWIIQKVVVWVIRKIVKMRNGDIGRELLEWHTIKNAAT